MVVRRLDEDVEVVPLPVTAGEDAVDLPSRVEASLRGPATDFEDARGISAAMTADPGPEQGWIPAR